jgi:hypothetical protein
MCGRYAYQGMFSFKDDILILSSTFEEHISMLESVFQRLCDHNMRVNPSKCQLFKSSVTYLGNVVSANGIATDPNNLQLNKIGLSPINIKTLRQLIRFTGYYSKFVRNYVQIVQPLNEFSW